VNPTFRQAFVITLMIVAMVFMTTGSTFAEEVTRVFLFAGQSNMVGSDANTERINDYPNFKGAGEPQNDVFYSYILGSGDEASKGWVPLKPLRSFGPEITFARRVHQQVPFPIAIIKSAVGGTTVAHDWNPDAPDKGQKLYPRTMKLIRESLDELDKRGIRYQLEAVMWHQGEAGASAEGQSTVALGPDVAPGVRGHGKWSAALSLRDAGSASTGRSVCNGVSPRHRTTADTNRSSFQGRTADCEEGTSQDVRAGRPTQHGRRGFLRLGTRSASQL
jgi:hypothetical protein